MAFSLNHAFIFIIVMFSVFGVLYGAMNIEFFSPTGFSGVNEVESIIVEEFKAMDMVVYSSQGSDNMTLGYTSITDGPSPPNWNTTIENRYLEVWWDNYYVPDVGTVGVVFQIRDTERRSFLGIPYYVAVELLDITIEGEHIGPYFLRSHLLPYGGFTQVKIEAKGTYLKASIILKANGTDTLIQSWDNNVLEYVISYEIDFNAMKPSTWQLVGRLLTFQEIDLGLPGELNRILCYIIGVGVSVCVALLILALVTSVIPLISGWRSD